MNIFITGGTSGIGLDLAKLYQKNGHTVGVCGINVDHANLTPFHVYDVDVTHDDALTKAVQDFSKGQLDLMIACAGVGMGTTQRIPDFKHAQHVIAVDFIGVVNAFAAAVPIMQKQKRGHLVAISSAAGFAGYPQSGAYSGAKAGVNVFCESLALDLANIPIAVSCICPGFIDTAMSTPGTAPMPWSMSAEKAATIIANAIQERKVFYIFPWQMRWLSILLSRMPRWLFRKIMQRLFYRCDNKVCCT